VVQGETKSYYSNGAVQSKGMYKNGYAHGEYITYRKNGSVVYRSRYANGTHLERKWYTKKNELVKWTGHKGDTSFDYRYNKKGNLVKSSLDPAPSGHMREIKYDYNGIILEDVTIRSQKRNAKNRYSKTEHLYFRLGRIISEGHEAIKATIHHPNGQLKLRFDLSQGKIHEIPVYDNKGRIRKHYSLTLTDTTTYVLVKETFDKNGHKEWVYVHTELKRSPIIKHLISVEGDTVYTEYDKEYLSMAHQNEAGIKLRSKSIGKNHETWKYNILHSDIVLYKVIEKGNLVRNFSIDTFTENNVLMHQWTSSRFDKSGRLEVRHTKKAYLPPHMKNDRFLSHASTYYRLLNQTSEVNSLLLGYDSLDYTILYDGKPFNGEVQVERNFGKHKYEAKLKTKKVHKVPIQTLHIKDNESAYYSKQTLQLTNGVPYNLMNYSRTWTYKNHKIHGEGQGRNTNYVNGLRHGLVRSASESCEYYHGLRHGSYQRYGLYSPERYYGTQIRYRGQFQLDTLHGWFYEYVRPMELTQKVWFEKGLPHGRYWRGNVTSPTAAEVTLHHGFLIDTAYYHFSEGGVKVKVHHKLSDEVFFDYPRQDLAYNQAQEYLMDSVGLNAESTALLIKHLKHTGFEYMRKSKLIDFKENRTGNYTYFYKNGIKASEGRIESWRKQGVWKYWDVNGGLYKVIDYDDMGQYIDPNSGDTIPYWGHITMWHPNGDSMFTGLILSSDDRFNCNQEMEVDVQNVFYLSYNGTNDNTAHKNGTGPVKEYHTNGEIRVLGNVVKGKKHGIWKFYTPQGRLEEIGAYEHGIRTGLWIKGDLEAVPYIEDLCVQGEMDSYKFPDIEGVGYLMTEINLEQTLYRAGIGSYHRSTRLLPLY